jgi:predicted ester cyclase
MFSNTSPVTNNNKANPMLTNRPESLIYRIIDQAFNQGNLAVVDKLLSPNHFTHIAFGGAPQGPAGLKWLAAMFRTAFPDLHCTIEDEIWENEKSSAICLFQGIHNGHFFGNSPTGQAVSFMGFIFARTKAGQVVESWTMIDQMGLLQQLGIVPPPRGSIENFRGV